MLERASTERSLPWELLLQELHSCQGETCRNKPGELLSKCLGAVSQSQDPAASAAAPILPSPSLCLGRMDREEHILDL